MGSGREASSDTKESGGETLNQADVKQGMYHTG